MSDGFRLFAGFAIALATTAAATPLVIALARRTGFYDLPAGYKQHAAPTPYLGGMAVGLGLLAGSLVTGGGHSALFPLLVVVTAMLALGTLDDRVGLSLGTRLAVEVGAAVGLYLAGLGWQGFDSDAANLVLTVIFVVGVVNAYNLMDNLDGATSTVALVAAAAIGMYAWAQGDPVLGALALALAGACAGFLPYNLARPAARIFLGDGGSMAIGVTLAALMMSLPGTAGFGWGLTPVVLVLVGLPAFDTALVIVSRLRRGMNVWSGGRDHLTHRLLLRLDSPRGVAVALALGQASLSALALGIRDLPPQAEVAGVAMLLGLSLTAIAFLEAPEWLSPALGAPRWEGMLPEEAMLPEEPRMESSLLPEESLA